MPMNNKAALKNQSSKAIFEIFNHNQYKTKVNSDKIASAFGRRNGKAMRH